MDKILPTLECFCDHDRECGKDEFIVFVKAQSSDDGDLAIARTKATAYRAAARVLRKLAALADTRAATGGSNA